MRTINLRLTVLILIMTCTAIFLYQPVLKMLGQVKIPSHISHNIKRIAEKDILFSGQGPGKVQRRFSPDYAARTNVQASNTRFLKVSDINKRDVNKAGQTSTSYPNPTTAQPINIYEYIEEKPADIGTIPYEMARLKRFLATQGAVCQDIRRIGGERSETWLAPRPYGADGAWDVCFDGDVGLVRGSCIVYSFGIGRDFSYDDGMAKYGCHVFSFDPTIGQSDHKRSSGVEFFNTGLSSFDQEGSGNNSKDVPKSQWKTRTLASVINELGHEKRFIDVVKIDIEGDEWRCLRQMLQDGTLRRYVRQLNIEFHLVFESAQQIREFYSIARWLYRQGIRVSSLHQNPYCEQCLEMNFINTRLRYVPRHRMHQ